MSEPIRKGFPWRRRIAARWRRPGRAFPLSRRVRGGRPRRSGDGLLFAALALGFAVLGVAGAIPAEGDATRWLLPSAVLTVWALGCAAAATLPAAGVAVAGIWLAHAGTLTFAAAEITWMLLLPVVWVLVPGVLAIVRTGPGSATAAGWILLSLGVGWLIADLSGFNARLGWTGEAGWRGAVLPGTVCGWAGWQLAMEWRARGWRELSPAVVLAISLAGASAIGMACASRSFPEFSGWVQTVAGMMRTGAAFGWYVVAGGFGLLLVSAAGRISSAASHLLTLRLFAAAAPLVWLAVTAVEWMIARGAVAAPAWLAAGAAMHRWAGVASLVMAAGFAWQGAQGIRILPRLNALWLMAAAASPALAAAQAAGTVSADSAGPSAGLWPAVILAGGLAWIAWQTGATGEWRPGTPAARAAVPAGILGTYSLTAGGWPAPGIALACAAGLLHVTLPCALYLWTTRHRDPAGRLPVLTQAWLSALGMVAALPIVKWNAESLWMLAAAAILWLFVLIWLRRTRPDSGPAEGALAGALVAGGTLAAWMLPGSLLPEVPYFEALNPPAGITGETWPVRMRPILQPAHFYLLVAMQAAGAVAGALLFRLRAEEVSSQQENPLPR